MVLEGEGALHSGSVASDALPAENGQAAAKREERRAVDLTGWLILEDGSTSPLQIQDLSYCGCKVTCAADVAKGSTVQVAVAGRGLIAAEVRWRREKAMGLRFPDVKPSKTLWPRRAERHVWRGSARLRRYGRLRYDLKVFDLATHGCKVEFVDLPSIGELVWLKLDGLEAVEAEVCWLDGYVGGLHFRKPLHPAVLSLYAQRAGL